VGDAAPADSGADASVRPAGRPARTRLVTRKRWLYQVSLVIPLDRYETPAH